MFYGKTVTKCKPLMELLLWLQQKKKRFQGKVTRDSTTPEIHLLHGSHVRYCGKDGSQKCTKCYRVSSIQLIFKKTRPLNSPIFTTLCYEIESNHENLYTEVCWLSCGKALKSCQSWVMHFSFTKRQVFHIYWPLLWWQVAVSSMLPSKYSPKNKHTLICPFFKVKPML